MDGAAIAGWDFTLMLTGFFIGFAASSVGWVLAVGLWYLLERGMRRKVLAKAQRKMAWSHASGGRVALSGPEMVALIQNGDLETSTMMMGFHDPLHGGATEAYGPPKGALH